MLLTFSELDSNLDSNYYALCLQVNAKKNWMKIDM